MNQNEIKEQMTEEELQRTQVLNFDDFKETARIERISSKKPAAIVAMIGLIAIIFGASYPSIQSLITKQPEETPSVQTRKIIEELETTNLSCTKTSANADGTDEKMEINYTFEDNKLTASTKVYTLTKTSGAMNADNALQSFKQSLPPYLTQQSGYEISVKEIENGVEITTAVNYRLLDVNKLPQTNQSNYRFNVTYLKDSAKESISQDMKTQEYTCS